MKLAVVWLVTGLVIPSLSSACQFSQNLFPFCRMDEIGSPQPQSEKSVIHVGGRFLTSTGTITSFVLFVRFADDNETSALWPDASTLPLWARNILNPTYKPMGNYTTNSFSDYIYENSYGKLHIVGDVYYVTLNHDEAYYYGLKSQVAAWTAIERDAFNKLAAIPDIDLAKYDQWKNEGDFKNVYTGEGSGQTKDHIVDLCWVILRNLHDGPPHSFDLYNGIAELYVSKTIKHVTIAAGYPGSGISMFPDGFIDQIGHQSTINQSISEHDNDGSHWSIIGTMAHELSHYFFGANHFGTQDLGAPLSSNRSSSQLSPYNINSPGWGVFMGYEKIRLGWISSNQIQVCTTNGDNFVIPDMETTSDPNAKLIFEIPIPGTGEFIGIENRSWKSIYEARYVPLNYGKPLKPGLLVYLIPHEEDYLSSTPVQQICADGKWQWKLAKDGKAAKPDKHFGYASPEDVLVKTIPDPVSGYDEREDIHISSKPNAKWWSLYYPNSYGSVFGRWYKGENYIDENHNVRDYSGDDKQLFGVGDVISPWSNGSTDTWDASQNKFVPTTIGIEVASYDSFTTSYTLKIRVTDPESLSPSRPQNLNGIFYQNRNETNPELTWTEMREPDVMTGGNIIVFRRTRSGGHDWGKWMMIATLDGSATQFVDRQEDISGVDPNGLEYRIQAVDSQKLCSNYSEIFSFRQ
jgi:hypothetical protein